MPIRYDIFGQLQKGENVNRFSLNYTVEQMIIILSNILSAFCGVGLPWKTADETGPHI